MERKKKGSDCFVEDLLIMPGSSFRPLAGDGHPATEPGPAAAARPDGERTEPDHRPP